MSIEVLILPPDAKEIVEFVETLKLHSEAETYRKAMLSHMKEHWGDDLGNDQDGYIDGTVDIIENGKLVYPFENLSDERMDTYISEKIGDFSLYGRLWSDTPSEYEIDVPINVGTTEDEYWVDLSLSLDRSFKVKSASVAYDTEQPGNKFLTYWILKNSN